MGVLWRIAEFIVLVQAIIVGVFACCLLWDLMFEKLLNTIGVGAAFKDFLCGPYFAKLRRERQAKEDAGTLG